MFKIYADGQLLYEPNQRSDGLVIGPTCDAEAGLSGQLSFTMLPGHYLYDTIKKLKTEIVATLDDEEIFRGRILNWDIDFYKNKKVHCEGDISYLLDSMQPPHDLKMTPAAYFTWMISEHNIQVDAPKRFTVGLITIDKANKKHDFIDASYRDTRDSIDSDLINVFGGFLRTRRVGAVTYLDYLKEYTEVGEQALEFGSNLIDLTQSLSSDEIFTILLPTGEPIPPVMLGAPSWPLTIESVNNGSKLLENIDAVAQFGRIVKNQFFEGITDAAALKAAGEDFLEKAYKAPFNSYTIQGLDLHLLDKTIQQFKVGLLCRIRSEPHGIDLTLPIVRIAWDFDNPDATEIVIAPLVREPSLKLTSNSGGISSTIGRVAGGGGGGKLYKYYTEGENWAKIQADNITLISGDMASQGAQIEINKNEIDLRVKYEDDIAALINANTEGVQIYGKNIELLGQNGFTFTAGVDGEINPETGDVQFHMRKTYTQIKATETDISLNYVKNNKILSTVNVNAEGVQLRGDLVEITGPTGIIAQGNLAVGNLAATNALIENLRAGNSSFSHILSIGHATINGTLQAGRVEIASGALVASEVSGTKVYGGTIYQGGTELNDLFAAKGHTHTTLGALTLSSLSVSGSTTLGAVGVSSLSTAGAITSTAAITGDTVAGTTLKQGGTELNDLFLRKTAKAADSNKLNGELASKYVLYTGLDNALANYSLTTHTHNYAAASHGHTKSAISDFPIRTSKSFVTEVTRSRSWKTVVTGISPYSTADVLDGVDLTVTKNTYYFYT